MPGAGNPLAWNRYAYVSYSPINYIDPGGHRPVWETEDDDYRRSFEDRYDITFIQGAGDEFWTEQRILMVKKAVYYVGKALGEILGVDSATAFSMIFGGLDFEYGPVDGGYGWAIGDHTIRFDDMYNDMMQSVKLVIHEIGHIFDRAVSAANNGGACSNIFGPGSARADLNGKTGTCVGLNCMGRLDYYGPGPNGFFGFAGGEGDWQFGAVWSTTTDGVKVMNTGEIWADMFVGWTLNSWETNGNGVWSLRGLNREIYMKKSMGKYVRLIAGGG